MQTKLCKTNLKTNTEETKSLLKDYPSFNPPYLARLSRWKHENCLSYALNHRLEGPNFYKIGDKKYIDKSKAISYVANELNHHYKDDEFVLIADYEAGR